MQIIPVLSISRPTTKNQQSHPTQFERSNNKSQYRPYHKYTGNVSADLAWASMYDNKIAKELKLLGLI